MVRADCPTCGERMRKSRVLVWCYCGALMSNNYGVFEEV